MRAAALLCLIAAGCAAAPAPRGGGIVSTNPCADAVLVELVAPERIAAISHYSHDPAASSIPPAVAARFHANRGTAEEIIAMRPDLVIASRFTPPATREAYARAGLRTLYVGMPATIAGSIADVREIAAATGAQARGEAIVARIEAAEARARAAARDAGPPVPALLWIGGNLVSGGGTLLDEMMTQAGFSDHSAHYGLMHTGYLSAERVIADPPRVMMAPEPPGRAAGSRAAALREWAVARSGAPVVQARFDRTLVNCGGPVIARALDRLAQIRREVR